MRRVRPQRVQVVGAWLMTMMLAALNKSRNTVAKLCWSRYLRTMTTTTAPTATLPAALDESWLAPDEGEVRMPCSESVPDTLDAVTAHAAECTDCQAALR